MEKLFDLLAPRATAETVGKVVFDAIEFENLVAIISEKIKTKKTGNDGIQFRVDGEFFADIRSVGILVGMKPEKRHVSKVGFEAKLTRGISGVLRIEAYERVIFGWFEKKTVSEAIKDRLDDMINGFERG